MKKSRIYSIPRRRKYLPEILDRLSTARSTVDEIAILTGIDRSTVYRNIAHAETKRLVKRRTDGTYVLTALGVSALKVPRTRLKAYTFDMQSGSINNISLAIRRYPIAKCTIISEDADLISRFDERQSLNEMAAFEDFVPVDGERTLIKSAAGLLLDRIVDAIGRSMGLASVQKGEYGDRLIGENPGFMVGHDIRKRILELSNRDFAVLIEFEGRNWVQHQDAEEIERTLDRSAPIGSSILANIPIMPLAERLRLAHDALQFYGISDNDYSDIESTRRLFADSKKARERLSQRLDTYLPEWKRKGGINRMLPKLEGARVVSYRSKRFFSIEIDDGKFGQFVETVLQHDGQRK